MSDKFTNGQWYLTDHCQYTVSVKVYNDDYYQKEETIAKIPQGDKSEQYARLIAAAPDLLEALKNLLQDTQHKEHEDCEDGPCPVREAREAVRKATGGAS